MPEIPEAAASFQKAFSSSTILERLCRVKFYSLMDNALTKHIRYAERYNSYARK
jgi:hypothetical protein